MGEPRLETWLLEHMGTPDTPYARAVGTLALVGAVARAYVAGIKFDTVLVTQGRQGIGKSTAFSGPFYAEGLPSKPGERDAVDAMQAFGSSSSRSSPRPGDAARIRSEAGPVATDSWDPVRASSSRRSSAASSPARAARRDPHSAPDCDARRSPRRQYANALMRRSSASSASASRAAWSIAG